MKQGGEFWRALEMYVHEWRFFFAHTYHETPVRIIGWRRLKNSSHYRYIYASSVSSGFSSSHAFRRRQFFQYPILYVYRTHRCDWHLDELTVYSEILPPITILTSYHTALPQIGVSPIKLHLFVVECRSRWVFQYQQPSRVDNNCRVLQYFKKKK